ncbi:MAG: AI-2E family transporter [Pirellulaceae bacterium]
MTEKNEASTPSEQLFNLLTLGLIVAALYYAKEILLPIALAVLLTFVLTPLVTRVERLRLGRIPSILLVLALACGAIGGVGWLATRQIVELGERLPDYKENLIERIRTVRSGTDGKFKEAKEAIEDISAELTEENEVEEEQPSTALEEKWLAWLNTRNSAKEKKDSAVEVKVVNQNPSPLAQIRTWLGPVVAPLSTLGLVFVLVFFILLNREDLRNRIIRLIGTSTLYATTEAIDDANNRLSRYLRMQLLINTIYGIVVAIGLALIGVPNALLWGVFGILLRFLPYVGPWIAASMPIALSMATSQGWSQPLWTVGLFLALELVVNNVLEPWLYGSSSGVSSMGVIVAAIFWTWLWGPIGLVLAMPLTVCAVVLGNYAPQLRFLPVLIGDRAALWPHEQMYQRLLAADDVETGKLAEDLLKSIDHVELYDSVLIPALQLAERDRHAGLLSERQETMVIETARELIEDLGERQLKKASQAAEEGATDTVADLPSIRVFCIPVRDQADETAAMVLGQVLSFEGFVVEVGSLDSLVSDTIEWVKAGQCEVAVLVVLPPLGSRNGRYLCRRLRQSKPDLRIVTALFSGESLKNTRQRLQDSGADVVVTNLPDTIDAVRVLSRQFDAARSEGVATT